MGPPPARHATDPRFSVLDAELRTFVNSDFPMGQNDGAVWQGKGLTTALDAGVHGAWRGLSVSIRPRLIYTQNGSFQLAPVSPGTSEYAYPWRTIDLPQRFGPDAMWTLDPGQSEVRLDARGVSAGFGTTNLWWGPSMRNAIVMSNHAPGIPHVFLGTHGPVGVRIGEIEARWIFGNLEQSDWFDPSLARTERFVTGLVGAFSPSFLPGLSVGLTRIFYAWVPPDGVPLHDYFAVFQGIQKKGFATPDNPTGEDEHDQLISLFGRWVLPESGFEVFGEWARNDHAWDFRDVLTEPEHSQGYTLGLQKAVDLSDRHMLALRTELTHLEREPTHLIRGINPTYYAHHIVQQGYTHRGQVIGAGVGPGGNGQYVGADLYAPQGRAGVYIQRDVRDNDAYYDWAIENDAGFCCHDVSFHLGAHALAFVDDFDVGAGVMVTHQYNRDFENRRDIWNVNLSLTAKWRAR